MFSRAAARSVMTRPVFATRPVCIARHLQSSARQCARKDTQDRESMNTESSEYSKTGGDGSAAHEEAAFSRDKTRPEEQETSSQQETKQNGSTHDPLNVSPANHEVSQGRDPKEGGAEGSPAENGQGSGDRSRTSGGGSPSKQGGSKSG